MQTQFDNVVRMDGAVAVEQTNKVLRNTYMLLSVTLIFSAVMAGVSMAMAVPYGVSLITSLEEQLGIEVGDDEIDGDTFATVGALVDFVSGKLNG